MLVRMRKNPLNGLFQHLFQHLGVSENRLNPIVPNGFHDHYPYEKWLYIIGNSNPIIIPFEKWHFNGY